MTAVERDEQVAVAEHGQLELASGMPLAVVSVAAQYPHGTRAGWLAGLADVQA